MELTVVNIAACLIIFVYLVCAITTFVLTSEPYKKEPMPFKVFMFVVCLVSWYVPMIVGAFK